MRTVHGLLQCFILAPFLSTGLAAPSVTSASFTPTESIPACAASPTVFASLGFEFWLQVVFLGPLPPLDVIGYKFAKDNPIRLHHDYYPYFPNQEIQYSRVYIAAQGLPRTLFILGDSFLLSPDFSGAVIWPDSPPSDTFPGWSPFVFDAWTMLNTTEVRFKAVKVCTSTNELELQLRPEGNFVFGAVGAGEIGSVSIFVKTQRDTTVKVVPLLFRVRPFVVPSQGEQIPVDKLGETTLEGAQQ